jgi:type I restriction-modification system DNA methylase subunit
MRLFQKSVVRKYLQGLDSEEVNAAWDKYSAHFHNPTIQDHIRNSKEEEYQEGFVRDLFVTVLGYTLKPQPDYDFVLEKKTEADATKSDGALLRSSNVIGVVELKDTSTADLDSIEKQVFGYKSKHKNCNYIITSNFEKLRFYISDAIDHEDFDLFNLKRDDFTFLYLCLSQKSIEADTPLKMKQTSIIEEKNITKKLYDDYSQFKNSLFNNIAQLNPTQDKLELFKKTQKLLDRLLFILFAEDRLLVPANSVREILNQWEKLKELDNYVPLYDRFKKYFGYLNTGHEGKQYDIFGYNGGLFAEDGILDDIKIEDKLLYNGAKTLSNYDYESEVDVNILGHIFEHSLSEIEEVQAELQGIALDKRKTKRKKEGIFYTPRYITKYIVENTVGKLCRDKKEELGINSEIFTYKKRKDARENKIKILNNYRSWLFQLTICDPACGSGAFLNQALEYLILEHKQIDELTAQLLGEAIVMSDVEKTILQNNLYGVDINEDAIEIARLSLWLRTAQKGRKLNDLSQHIKCGNSLIGDPSVAGDKAFNWEKEFPEIFEKGGFDVVIGNPPYVTGSLANTTHEFFKQNYQTAQYQLDLYILFIERSVSLISKSGLLSFITPNSWLKNMMMSDCRKFLLENTAIHSIAPNLPDVFDGVSVDSLIFILSRDKSSYINTAIVELIDSKFDLKHSVDQSGFYSNDKYVFSVELNQGLQEIIEKIRKSTIEVGKIFDVTRGVNPYDIYTGQSKEVIESKAYHADHKRDETFLPELRGLHVSRYNYHWDSKHYISYGDWLAAPRDPKYFKGERILFREILGEKFVCTYINEDFIVDRSLYIALPINEEYDCRYGLAILASKLMAFYFRFVNNEFDALFPKIRVAEFKMLPIRVAAPNLQKPFTEIVDAMISKKKEYRTIKEELLQLLRAKYDTNTFSKKLEGWPSLNFKDFLKELKKQKIKLTVTEEAEWVQYFDKLKAKATEIEKDMTAMDDKIDHMVYSLYDLSEAERLIIEQGGVMESLK